MSIALSSEMFSWRRSLPCWRYRRLEALANQRWGTILWPISDAGWLDTTVSLGGCEIVPASAYSAWRMSGPGTQSASHLARPSLCAVPCLSVVSGLSGVSDVGNGVSRSSWPMAVSSGERHFWELGALKMMERPVQVFIARSA